MILLNNSNKKSKDNQEHLGEKKESNPLIHVSSTGKKVIKEEKSGKKNLVEEIDYDIPEIPEPPKKSSKLTLSSPGLSAQILKDVKNLENDTTKVVLVNFETVFIAFNWSSSSLLF